MKEEGFVEDYWMESEATRGPTWERIVGWMLVAAGATAVIFITSKTTGDFERQDVLYAALLLAGSAWIVLGWVMLRSNKWVLVSGEPAGKETRSKAAKELAGTWKLRFLIGVILAIVGISIIVLGVDFERHTLWKPVPGDDGQYYRVHPYETTARILLSAGVVLILIGCYAVPDMLLAFSVLSLSPPVIEWAVLGVRTDSMLMFIGIAVLSIALSCVSCWVFFRSGGGRRFTRNQYLAMSGWPSVPVFLYLLHATAVEESLPLWILLTPSAFIFLPLLLYYVPRVGIRNRCRSLGMTCCVKGTMIVGTYCAALGLFAVLAVHGIIDLGTISADEYYGIRLSDLVQTLICPFVLMMNSFAVLVFLLSSAEQQKGRTIVIYRISMSIALTFLAWFAAILVDRHFL